MAAHKNYLLNDKFPKQIKNATSTSDGLMSAEDKSRLDELFEFGLLSPAEPDHDGLMSKEDKIKLDSIEEGANNYTHPATHLPSIIAEDATHRFITDTERTTWNAKANNAIATQTSNGLMSKEDKIKLDTIEDGLNNYVHPDTHPATMITQDDTHRFITDTERTTWNAKASTALATTSVNGLMSSTDKAKLDNIEENANNYTHPATHLASIIVQDETHRFVTDIEKNSWNNILSNLKPATQTANGLMSADDKKKLDSMSPDANKYVHPDTHPATMITQDDTHRFVSDNDKTNWNNKVDSIDGKALSTNDYTTAEKNKLEGIDDNANNYIHPPTHSATMITEDAAHRFVTDTEKATWNAKASNAVVTQTANGLMSKEDKIKLDSIDEVSGNYTHPATHPATMIVEDAAHRFVTDTEKTTWNSKANNTVATQTANGLMSKADKIAFDNLLTRMSSMEQQQAEMLAKLKTAVFI